MQWKTVPAPRKYLGHFTAGRGAGVRRAQARGCPASKAWHDTWKKLSDLEPELPDDTTLLPRGSQESGERALSIRESVQHPNFTDLVKMSPSLRVAFHLTRELKSSTMHTVYEQYKV